MRGRVGALSSSRTGAVSPTGKLPVDVPAAGDPATVLYPFGFGLGYGAAEWSDFSLSTTSVTPASLARRVACATMSGLYSMPWPRAPNCRCRAST